VTAAFQQELWYIPLAGTRPPARPVLVHTFDQVTSGLVETQPDVFHISTFFAAARSRAARRSPRSISRRVARVTDKGLP
jgi:hypothetical protein